MKEIIIKDLLQQRYLLMGGGLLLILTSLIPVSAGLLFLITPSFIIPLLVIIMGVLTVESGEEKNYGYVLLSTLPISRVSVIGAKFISLLSECVGFSVISLAVLSLKNVGKMIPVNLSVCIAIGFSMFVIISVVSFSGIYILGLKNFTRAMLILMISAQMLVFIFGVQRFNGVDRTQEILKVFTAMIQWHPIVHIGIGLIIWGILLLFTSQFRKRV